MSSRRTESRNLTGNGKVGGSRTSPRAVRRLVDHDTWVTGERNKREGKYERTGKRCKSQDSVREGRAFHHYAKRRATANEATVRKDQMTADLPRGARRKGF